MSSLCRLLPFAVDDGPSNMAADDTLLHSAADAGIASLRFYGWRTPTTSLGYFQPAAPARALPGLEDLPWLRRPSGGAALVHHHELTYALAIPAGPTWQPRGLSWLIRMHQVIQGTLAGLGVHARLCEVEVKQGPVLCFLHHTPGDLLLGSNKITGSAQRKQRGALLQHGSILLAQSNFAPVLAGIAELTGRSLSPDQLRSALLDSFVKETGWHLEPAEWSSSERTHAAEQEVRRYRSRAWNEKR